MNQKLQNKFLTKFEVLRMSEPQKAAADQMDGCQARGQTKALFGQPGDST